MGESTTLHLRPKVHRVFGSLSVWRSLCPPLEPCICGCCFCFCLFFKERKMLNSIALLRIIGGVGEYGEWRMVGMRKERSLGRRCGRRVL